VIHTCVVGDIGVNDVKCDVVAILVEEDAAGGELAREEVLREGRPRHRVAVEQLKTGNT